MGATAPGSRAYEGGELRLFAAARNWKSYWACQLAPLMGTTVLDVGAGFGETAVMLAGHAKRWVCLEPDEDMAAAIGQRIQQGELPGTCEVRIGTLNSMAHEMFDTIVYIDVLEHIADDRGELAKAAEHLPPGGRVVVLGPAHQWLFSPFDQAIGHHRRYTVRSMAALTPPSLKIEKAFYLDTAGLAASLANSLLLKSSMPTAAQIKVWDRFIVPVSRIIDPLHGRRFGKTAVTVWRRR